MGGTREEPTGRHLAPVSPFPHFRSEDNSVATSRPKVIFFSLRGQQGVLEKMPGDMIKQERGNATLAPPPLLPGRDLQRRLCVDIQQRGGKGDGVPARLWPATDFYESRVPKCFRMRAMRPKRDRDARGAPENAARICGDHDGHWPAFPFETVNVSPLVGSRCRRND